METLLVSLAGLAAIAWIVWYFFLTRREERPEARTADGVQEAVVTVRGGYIPDTTLARPGLPLRLHFRREETSACSEEVVFPDFGIRRHLPPFETTVIELSWKSRCTPMRATWSSRRRRRCATGSTRSARASSA